MRIKKALICVLLALSVSLMFATTAFADTLDDFGGVDSYNYYLWVDNSKAYDVELKGLGAEFSLPLERISTNVVYNDNDVPFLYNVTISAYCYIAEEDYAVKGYTTTAEPILDGVVSLVVYADEEQQDALFEVIVSLYNDVENRPGNYAYDLDFVNYAGYESIDYESTVNFEMKRSDLVETPLPGDEYWDGWSDGYDEGYNAGWSDGYTDGQNGLGATDVPKTIFGVVMDIISTPILGFISVADILLIVICLGLLFFFLRIARGG